MYCFVVVFSPSIQAVAASCYNGTDIPLRVCVIGERMYVCMDGTYALKRARGELFLPKNTAI